MHDKLEVIVVERDSFLRDFLVKCFNRDSIFKADGVTNYQEVYERLKSTECHLIIADGDEPNIYEFAKKLRSENNTMPVFLYFDMNTMDDIFEIVNSRIDGIIAKPINMKYVRDAAVDCIWRYFQQQSNAYFEGKA